MKLLLHLLAMGAATAKMVEIEKYFGSVTFIEGKPQAVGCTMEEGDLIQFGVFTWRIGDRQVDPRACGEGEGCLVQGEQGEEDMYDEEEEEEEKWVTETLRFIPEIEDDGNPLVCEYGLPGEEPLGSDKVDLVVYRRRVEQVEAREVEDGQPMVLQVEADIYPAPDPTDFLWRVQSAGGSEITRVHPGGAHDPQVPGYSAGPLQMLEGTRYRLNFTIASMNLQEAGNRFSLEVLKPEPTSTLNLNTPFLLSRDDDETEEDATEEKEDKTELTEDEPRETTTSGLSGIFIIVGILILCVVLCIVFCVIRKKKKNSEKKRTAADGKGEFTAVQTKDPPVPV